MSINKFFDKIYVITIRPNKERHKYINELFEKKKITNYEFIYGKESKNLNIREMVKNKLVHPKWLDEEVGGRQQHAIDCILTHKAAWKDMVDNNYNQCVFFEDDVHFLDEFDKNFDNFIKNVPEDWSVLQMGSTTPNFRYPKDKKINDFVIKSWATCSGTSFYALTKKSAKILIDNLYPITKGSDGYIGDMTNSWTKQRGIYLYAYTPTKCFAVDCSHYYGQSIQFKSASKG